MQEYVTVEKEAQEEFIERRSRFIGHIKPVQTEEEALRFINEKKSEYWDASHNVYAYLLRNGNIQRYSDDGEPQGTAGIPVLDVLRKEGVTDVVAVVTRYFGGILLGGGGLVRAYSHSAKIALDAARRMVMSPCSTLEIECDYGFYGKLSYILPKYRTQVLESDFGVVVRMQVLMKQELLGAFRKELRELSADTVFANETGQLYAEIPE